MCASKRRCSVTARPRTSCASAMRSWIRSVCLTAIESAPAVLNASVSVFEQTTRTLVFSALNASEQHVAADRKLAAGANAVNERTNCTDAVGESPERPTHHRPRRLR